MENKYLIIKRSSYGNPTTPIELREYRIVDAQNCPVGTISNWKEFAKENGYNKLRIIENDETEQFLDV